MQSFIKLTVLWGCLCLRALRVRRVRLRPEECDAQLRVALKTLTPQEALRALESFISQIKADPDAVHNRVPTVAPPPPDEPKVRSLGQGNPQDTGTFFSCQELPLEGCPGAKALVWGLSGVKY